jgi:cytochrome oxidase Cu insertion factor (SCO1/SenC/PrrC family)
MHKPLLAVALVGLAIGLPIASAQDKNTSQDKKRAPQQGSLKVGDVAPDFTIKDVDGKDTMKLSALKGKPVVLIFGSCT